MELKTGDYVKILKNGSFLKSYKLKICTEI